MDNLLLLPGNHPDQRGWIRSVRLALNDLFAASEVVDYTHWNDPDQLNILMEHELTRLSRFTNDDRGRVVLGKSAGAVLGILAANQGFIQPQKAVFIGLPLHFSRQKGAQIEQMLDNLEVPVLFIQQENDPVGSAADLQAMLNGCPNLEYTLAVLPGKSHDYDDLGLLRHLVIGFLG